jgi:DNA replication protein DnaC
MEKLVGMKLKGMAHAVQELITQGASGELSFEDIFGLVVDREWMMREDRRMARRLREASLKQKACVEDIDYRHPRGLDKKVMKDLITGRWIAAKRNVIMTGPTGLGKSWLSCALAQKACRDGWSTRYTRVPRLVHELTLARADGSYLKFLAKLAKVDLLILDDWGLCRLDGTAQHDILEVIDDRVGQRSTLVTSQYPVSKWHDTIGDPSVADALLDRLLEGATQIKLQGESKRKGSSETRQDDEIL